MSSPYKVGRPARNRIALGTKVNGEHIQRITELAALLKVSRLEVIVRAIQFLYDNLRQTVAADEQPKENS